MSTGTWKIDWNHSTWVVMTYCWLCWVCIALIVAHVLQSWQRFSRRYLSLDQLWISSALSADHAWTWPRYAVTCDMFSRLVLHSSHVFTDVTWRRDVTWRDVTWHDVTCVSIRCSRCMFRTLSRCRRQSQQKSARSTDLVNTRARRRNARRRSDWWWVRRHLGLALMIMAYHVILVLVLLVVMAYHVIWSCSHDHGLPCHLGLARDHGFPYVVLVWLVVMAYHVILVLLVIMAYHVILVLLVIMASHMSSWSCSWSWLTICHLGSAHDQGLPYVTNCRLSVQCCNGRCFAFTSTTARSLYQ